MIAETDYSYLPLPRVETYPGTYFVLPNGQLVQSTRILRASAGAGWIEREVIESRFYVDGVEVPREAANDLVRAQKGWK